MERKVEIVGYGMGVGFRQIRNLREIITGCEVIIVNFNESLKGKFQIRLDIEIIYYLMIFFNC